MAPMAGPCWCGSPNGGSDAWCIRAAVLPGLLYGLSCISRGCFLYPPSMPAVCGLYQLYWLWMLSGCCWAYLLAQACSSAKAPGAHICTTSLTPPGATQPRISPECHQKANGGGGGETGQGWACLQISCWKSKSWWCCFVSYWLVGHLSSWLVTFG